MRWVYPMPLSYALQKWLNWPSWCHACYSLWVTLLSTGCNSAQAAAIQHRSSPPSEGKSLEFSFISTSPTPAVAHKAWTGNSWEFPRPLQEVQKGTIFHCVNERWFADCMEDIITCPWCQKTCWGWRSGTTECNYNCSVLDSISC